VATSLTTTEAVNVPVAVAETASVATAAREKASIEARALMAMHRPRNFDAARLRLLAACKRPRFAETARYTKPVSGEKAADGLSIRFAEEARVLWGNVDVSSFLVFDDDERRVYRVVGTDLETNASDGVDVMIEKTVERRSPREGDDVIRSRTNSKGSKVYLIRANEDALLVKVNREIAKARRNVILTLLPADIKEECEAQCIETVRDRDAKDPDGARKALLGAFFEIGVTPEQLVEYLGHPIEQLNPAELHVLRKVYTGIKDGEATWTDIMELKGGDAAKKEAQSKTDALRDKLAAKRGNGNPTPKPATGTTVLDPELEAELARQLAEDAQNT
jgi:hypothetical protein